MDKFKQKTYRLLRWSERYTGTDMVYLAKGGFLLTSGHIVSSGVVFLSAIAFANFIPKETYGIYKYLISIVATLSVTTLSGVGEMLTQSVSRGNEGTFIPALKTKIKWGLLGAIGSLGISFYYFVQGNNMLATIFAITSLFVPFVESLTLYQSYLQGKKLFTPFTIYITLSQVIGSAIMIATIYLTNSIYIIILSYYLAWTLIRLFFHSIVVRKYPPNNKVDEKVIPYGKKSTIVDFIASGLSTMEKALIFHFLGPVPLAIYSFAQAPLTQFTGLFRNIPVLAVPKMASRPIESINSMLKNRMLVAFAFSLLAAVTYIFLAPFFYKFILPQYLESVKISQLLALTILFTIPQIIFGSAVNAKATLAPIRSLYLWNTPAIVSLIIVFFTIQGLGLYSLVISRIAFVALVTLITAIIWHKIKQGEKVRNQVK